ncbi:hypothetical protein TanjilG_13051 [Lupinus angustifolius]|uniref:BHLH domain-containing protein n=1 Tax=Lupinus angustifolius TaxID=3871 RepID=A0A1J7G6Y3_LUPAN|nr:hypothetical protein TanjilG_13051 [Lupinus angustifolius]
MEYGIEDWLCTDIEEFSLATENGSSKGRMGRKKDYNDDTREFKSKNLETERRRREKLSNRLLMLRSLVPNITNASSETLDFLIRSLSIRFFYKRHLLRNLISQMNKATIIDDATTYITELQGKVESLTQELHQMEANSDEKTVKNVDEVEVEVEEGVRLAQIDANKFWVKIIIENKRGSFKKLMEGMNLFGFELVDTNLINTKGALFIEGCMHVTLGKGADGERLLVHQIKKLLQDIISEI